MKSERWKRIEEIYDAVLERTPAQRDAFLAQACGGDDLLRRDVEKLIAAHDNAGSFLGSPRGKRHRARCSRPGREKIR
jgi:eukaryotic-like serine/threonine-protein kinase